MNPTGKESPGMVRFTLNGREIEAPPEQTVLDAALAHGVDIPRLCHDPRLHPVAACRLCQVHVGGVGVEPVGPLLFDGATAVQEWVQGSLRGTSVRRFADGWVTYAVDYFDTAALD